MKKPCVFLILLACAALAAAQDYVGKPVPFSVNNLTAPVNNGLLDPARFSMQQSYSMSYVTGGGQSDMTGLYLNRMQYSFKVPLTLQVDVGFFHKPMELMGGAETPPGAKNAVLTVPHVGLTYRPSNNFMMSFEYFQAPAGYGNALSPYGFFNNPYYSPLLPASASSPASHP